MSEIVSSNPGRPESYSAAPAIIHRHVPGLRARREIAKRVDHALVEMVGIELSRQAELARIERDRQLANARGEAALDVALRSATREKLFREHMAALHGGDAAGAIEADDYRRILHALGLAETQRMAR